MQAYELFGQTGFGLTVSVCGVVGVIQWFHFTSTSENIFQAVNLHFVQATLDSAQHVLMSDVRFNLAFKVTEWKNLEKLGFSAICWFQGFT